MSTLRAKLLGSFRLWQNDEPLDLESARLELLLAYLLLNPTRAHPRQTLAFHFWPDSTDAQARTNLRKALYRLRRRWPDVEQFLHVTSQTLRWREAVTLDIDVATFGHLVNSAADTENADEQAELLQAAAEIGHAELLPNHYEDWVIRARERHRKRYLDLLETLIVLQERRRNYESAIANARRLVDLETLHEEGYRRLMRLHALAGDRASALRVYHTCASRLRQELDIEPSAATRRAYEQLLQRDARPIPPSHQRTPLVARQEEWRWLQESWHRAARGASRAVLISGEAGIGKSRLAEELRQWTVRQGITAMQTACYAAESGLPYAPLMAWLRADPVQSSLAGLDNVWLVELLRLLPELSARHPQLPAPEPLETAWQRQRLFEALTHAITSAGDPLLLIIDDLHWSDPESLDWLRFLLRHARDRRLLLLGTVRNEELPADHPLHRWRRELLREETLTEISLERLDLEATVELAGHTGNSAPDRDTAIHLFTETEGNPLFIVEWTRAADAGDGSPMLWSGTTLPDRVHAVLEARLDRLTAASRELAGGAALIGRSFSGRLLAAASDLEENGLLDALDELWRKQIIREHGVDAYDFTHNKLRQVAAASLPPGQKRRWHQRIIAALREQHEDELRAVHDQLAVHYRAVGKIEEAIDQYQAAAGVASLVFAHREAVAHLRRALELADPGRDMMAGVVPRETVAALYETLGDARILLGERPAARDALTAALERRGEALGRAQLWLKIAQTWLSTHNYLEADVALNRSEAALGEPSVAPSLPRWKTWLDLQLARIDWLYFQARLDELDALCEKIRDPVLAYGDAPQKANYFVSLVMAAHRRQRFVSRSKDIAHQREALKWARAAARTLLVTRMTFSLGFTLLCGGRLQEAEAALAEAVARSRREGNRPVHNQSLAYLTIAHRLQSHEDRVRHLLTEAHPLAVADENRFYLGVAHANQAWLAYRDGDLPAAVRGAQEALEQWQGLAYPFRGLALWPRLAAALAGEEWAPAVEAAQAILDPSQQQIPTELAAPLEQLMATPTDASIHADLLTRARSAGYL